MNINLYSLLDTVSGLFMHPHCAVNDATAVRAVTHQASQAPEIRANAKDYALYRLGVFDDNSGTITPEVKPQLIVQLNSLFTPAE